MDGAQTRIPHLQHLRSFVGDHVPSFCKNLALECELNRVSGWISSSTFLNANSLREALGAAAADPRFVVFFVKEEEQVTAPKIDGQHQHHNLGA